MILRTLFIVLIPGLCYSQSQKNVELLDQWNNNALVTSSTNIRYNECWGFLNNENEYAIIGSTEGSHIFGLPASNKLTPLVFVPGDYSNASVVHRDYASYQNYIYAVCDEGESSLQIIDIQNLPDSTVLVSVNDTTFARVHNIFIDEESALLYACIITPKVNGVLQGSQPMQVFSLADPLNPTLLYTGPNDIPEVHDIYIRDNIAFLNCGSDGLRVYDFSNPVAPNYLQNVSFYQDQGYNHQGWLSEDGGMYVFGDETNGKRLKKCTVSNNQITIGPQFGTNWENNSVPHNVMIRGNFAYVAYYNEGLRIYDLRPQIPVEVAHFDTYPEEETLFTMRGAWGVYNQFPSNRILVSDRVHGLFLLNFNHEVFDVITSASFLVYSNPVQTGESFTVRVEDSNISEFYIEISDEFGRVVFGSTYQNQSYAVIEQHWQAGAYTIRLRYLNYLGDEIIETSRLTVF